MKDITRVYIIEIAVKGHFRPFSKNFYLTKREAQVKLDELRRLNKGMSESRIMFYDLAE